MSDAADGGIARVTRVVAVVGVLMTAGAALAFGPRAGLGTAFGAVLAVSNLWMLGKIIGALLPPPESEPETAEGDVGSGPSGSASDGEPARGAKASEGAEDAEDAEEPPPPRRGSAAVWSLLAGVKILVLFGGAWFMMTRGWVGPMHLLAGYGSLPIGIAVSTLRPARRARRAPQRKPRR